MKALPALVFAACGYVVGYAPAAVRAQDDAHAAEPAQVSEAKKLHSAAVDAFGKGDYRSAVDGFVAADRLSPRAGFLFNIAKSYDALHEPSHALAAYRGYLHQAASAPDAKQVAQRVKALSTQREQHNVAQVSVLSQPLGAQVFLDGAPVGTTPIALDLTLGDHVIVLSLAGYRELRSSVAVASEQPLDLSFALEAIDVGKPSPVQPADAPSAVALSTPRPPSPTPVTMISPLELGGFVSLGAGVVALGAGIAFEVMRARTERGAQRESVQTEFAQDLDTISTQQTLARVFAGGGVVLAAVGGALLGIAYTASDRKPQTTALSISCLPSDCKGVLSGVF
jgi:hypothetical protein